MDDHLRNLRRSAVEGANPELLLFLHGLARSGSSYAASAVAAAQQPALRLLELRRFTCGRSDSEVVRFLHEPTGLLMVLIPGAVWILEEEVTWIERSGEEASEVHRLPVQVDPFLLSETPCTQAAWDRVAALPRSAEFPGPDRPVDSVSWLEATQWAEAAGLRLPTELEWEYACRAGSRDRFPFGDDAERLAEFAWFDASSDGETHPVRLKLPNAFGLHDMLGNVWEWCSSTWCRSGLLFSLIDPREPLPGGPRVHRGGCYCNEPRVLSIDQSRCRHLPDFFDDGIGFRPALTLPPR